MEIKDLKMILEYVNQAYVDRNKNKIDEFMETLFEKDTDATIVGTSNYEWCLNYEDIKDIFVSDWEYWGDVRLVLEDAIINEYDNYGLVYVPATLKYTFKTNKDTYARYLNSVKENLETDKSNKRKLTEISWILSHLLTPRDVSERTYLLDLRISFILLKKGLRWYIKHMQFSIPTVGYLPDERLDKEALRDEESLKSEAKLKKYIEKYNKDSEVKELYKNFILSYKDNKQEDVEKYFSKDICILDFDNQKYGFNSTLDLISKHQHLFDEINFLSDKCIIKRDNNIAWIITEGIFEKKMTEEAAFQRSLENIEKIINCDISDLEKLFKIRRDIVETVKENAKGENYNWPFRFEGFLVKENGNWEFTYLQFSLPFGYMLEGKTEAAVLLFSK